MQCPGGSASTDCSYLLHQDWSPQTALTAATTPPRSPRIIREHGSRLLPKPRDQDQPSNHSAYHHGHNRTASLPTNVFSMQFGPALPQSATHRRSISPYGHTRVASTASMPTPAPFDHLGISRPSMSSMRSVSSSAIRTHTRNISSSSIDATMLSRYGYPTYRHSPTPQPASRPMSRTPSAMSHLTPIAMPGGQMQSYPNSRRTASPPATSSSLSLEPEIPEDFITETSTVLDYLTSPNPTPSLIQRINDGVKSQANHFWFDIRNIRPWSDFNIDTITSIPGLLDLLKIDVPVTSLPTPPQVNLSPEHPSHLVDLCAQHHAIKVNAALKVAQGEKHMAMRTLTPGPKKPRHQQPEFLANYQSDSEKPLYGDGRGRVIGVVKSYHQWNSGYRNGSPIEKIYYLEHLAHLHKHMREHGTRYGFIITEIELVCVRYGGGGPSSSNHEENNNNNNNNNNNIPYFGSLELAPPIQISTSGRKDEDGTPNLTVDLALFFLHMLAKEQSFPGQEHWKLEIGTPSAMTRRHHLKRDEWMPKVNVQDKRTSKRVRGWTFPDEPLHKREGGRGRGRGK
ncbi:uncharacterized protein MYCFIDRAFT_35594 [Pseudocercospora fijiensis CIRAD86]|uniref:Sialidase n=1 Tax=Pseudocercospora fijiensis (strain CIRAD86) TaxID=383855 RepID=N1Q7Q2_PSEFD|nr:uncharacterized protein MYCFIDRAFT_35594 [Pseudocercospora fijiensis CIRAD86]EME88760.1 hypothetical protein MYCFIDRAFT_35594 [Pseudocercospora fijiensis CIRAD86]